MVTPRERMLAALRHEVTDRIPINDYLWSSTVERWRAEGLPREIPPAEHFGFELVQFDADTSPRFPVEVIEESEERVVVRDFYGGVRHNRRDFASTPEIIDYPIKTRADWERIKERLSPDPGRIDWEGNWPLRPGDSGNMFLALRCTTASGGLPGCRRARACGLYLQYEAYLGFDKLQWYMAPQQLLVELIDNPDWVREMIETDAELALQQYDLMVQGSFQFDGVRLVSDLGYRNGLLFSPRLYDRIQRPTMRHMVSAFKERGLPVTLHSCGSVRQLLPRFIEDGIDGLDPLESKAVHMDLVELKEEFGDRIALIGGIDVRAMADPDPTVIEAELRRKITCAKQGGGYAYMSDHSVPDNVSLAQYRRVMELVREYGQY